MNPDVACYSSGAMRSEHVQALHAAIQTRPRPEDVAELVLDVLGPDATPDEIEILGKAARR